MSSLPKFVVCFGLSPVGSRRNQPRRHCFEHLRPEPAEAAAATTTTTVAVAADLAAAGHRPQAA